MKQLDQSIVDFRIRITPRMDLVISAKAEALGVDKSAVVWDLLNRWVKEELEFARCLSNNEADTIERAQTRRQSISRRLQNAIYARDGLKCRECGAEPGPDLLQLDHIVPVSAGGQNELRNLRVLCRDCNLRKSNKVVAISGTTSGKP